VQLTASHSGSTVNVQATNTSSGAVTLSAKVLVLLENDTKETVFTNTATVLQNGTVILVGQATGPVKHIIDDPEPIIT